jgi:hypothetical protein
MIVNTRKFCNRFSISPGKVAAVVNSGHLPGVSNAQLIGGKISFNLIHGARSMDYGSKNYKRNGAIGMPINTSCRKK